MIFKNLLMIFTLIFPAIGYSASLFTVVPEYQLQDILDSQISLIEKLRHKKTTKALSVIRMDLGTLNNEEITLNLHADRQETATVTKIEMREENNYTWYGTLSDILGDAILVIRGNKVTGTVRSNTDLYRIQPIGLDLHVLIKVDEAMFPLDHPPSFEWKEEHEPDVRLDLQQQDSHADNPIIDVLVAYTSSADSSSGDINGLIQLAIDETNQSYQNSAVNMRLRLVHTHKVKYEEESKKYTDILNHLSNDGDKFMDDIHQLRNRHNADIVILIINNSGFCGMAKRIMASASTAFALVHYDCATGNYTFGHEIGHLLGARHNPEVDSNTTPFSYGHGYRHNSEWRTIMAYKCEPKCPRLQYWSNPDVYYGSDNDVSMGTATEHNNVRVLNGSAIAVSKFREPLIKNGDFKIPSSRVGSSSQYSGLSHLEINKPGNQLSEPIAYHGHTGAENWKYWLSTSGTLNTQLLPSSKITGNSMIEVDTDGIGNGIVQVFAPANTGYNKVSACVEIHVIEGRVGIGIGNGGNTHSTVWVDSNEHMEQIRLSNGVSPANEIIMYSDSPEGALFEVDSVRIIPYGFGEDACKS